MPTSTIDEELRVRGGVEEDEELAQQVELPAADSEGAAGRGISEEEGGCHAWRQHRRSVEKAATQRDEAATPWESARRSPRATRATRRRPPPAGVMAAVGPSGSELPRVDVEAPTSLQSAALQRINAAATPSQNARSSATTARTTRRWLPLGATSASGTRAAGAGSRSEP